MDISRLRLGIQSESMSNTSRDALRNYIKQLSKDDILKILMPFKQGLLHEKTKLYIDITKISLDYVIIPITIEEFLNDAGDEWKQWYHNIKIDPTESVKSLVDQSISNFIQKHSKVVISGGSNDDSEDDISIDLPPTNFIKEYVNKMSIHKKKQLLSCAKNGLITDTSLINIPNINGSNSIEIQFKKILAIIITENENLISRQKEVHWFHKLLTSSHFSSGNFASSNKLECDLRKLQVGRHHMSIWYTIIFAFMTLTTFCSHIWSTVTNYEEMQNLLSITIGILVVTSALISALVYLVSYMVAFLFCTENTLKEKGLSDHIPVNPSPIYNYFSELHHYKTRIKVTKVIQFIFLWYTMGLSVFAHVNRLNIYPALVCVLSNGFGLTLFNRIAIFFQTCRSSSDGKILHAR
uniref:Transmembrane protein n=1 Tax=Strongyloides venezuelensis TaxID=75913 RepID=A0A0K0EXR3_STRVS